MKQLFSLTLILLITLTSLTWAANHAVQQDQKDHVACPYCGMDRVKFAHSRMLIEYDDATSVGTCSIRCLAVEFVNAIDKTPIAIKVGDFATKKLIDAETAHWVIVDGKMGVMTSRAKWAFADKAAADAYIAKNGGTMVDFDTVMIAAYEDLYKDTSMIRKKRKMKRMKKAQEHK